MDLESNVNHYAKIFPAVFKSAEGEFLYDKNGKRYLDFFCGAGVLNYGHNHPSLKEAIYAYLNDNSIVHCLDMDSEIRIRFLENFDSIILKPRRLTYKFQFTGPTGTNAVEAAVKLARIVTGRKKIISFTNSFHGMTSASIALSGSLEAQQNLNALHDVIFFPYDNYLGEDFDANSFMEKMVCRKWSGIELPAAILVETIQAEGGVNVGTIKWFKRLSDFATENKILLIVDDIQVGCGRSGSFFSFERLNIIPDIVLLSKSLSGFGLPLSLVLLKPELDVWMPGQHNGTFRSNNLALCTATKTLDFWLDKSLLKQIHKNEGRIKSTLSALAKRSDIVDSIRGVGMIWGIELKEKLLAKKIATELFKKGIIIETCGAYDHVLKILPPLNICDEHLDEGLSLIASTILDRL